MTLRQRFEAISRLSTHGPSERVVMLAALYWANADGVLWPCMENWARMAGITVRTLQRVLKRLLQNGFLIVMSPSSGGPRKTVRYAIPALANPDSLSRLQHRNARHKTVTNEVCNPDIGAQRPRRSDGGTTTNNQENYNQQAVMDIFSRLGIEHLRDDPRATPDRLAWIEREAPTKKMPGAWAASCIREGWSVPEPSPADSAATCKAMRDHALANFDAMPELTRRGLLATARQQFPNLCNLEEDHPAMRGAVAKVILQDSKPRCGDGCHAATYGVHSGHGPTDQSDSSGGKSERANALCDRQGGGRSP